MGLESAGIEFINQLVDSYPEPGDVRAQGDDHLRLIKRVLKHSFPNFTAAMTRTAAELNAAPVKTGAETISGAWAFTAPVTVPVGSPSAPSIAFAGDSNTGMYSEGANVINFATEGVERLSITGSEVAVQAPIWVPVGSAAAPTYTFGGEANTGIYRTSGGGAVSVATSGVDRLTIGTTRILPTVPVQAADGSYTAPTYSFDSDSDTGFYRSNGGEVSYASDGAKAVTFNVSGLSLHRIAGSWTGIQFFNSAGDRRGLLDLDSEDGNLALYPVTGSGSGTYGNPVFKYTAASGSVQFDYPIRQVDGSAASPGVCFGNEYNTGIHRLATAQVGLSLAGTNCFTFTASGLEGPATGVASGDNRYSTNAGVVAALTEIASYDTLYNSAENLPVGAAAEIGGWSTATNATAKYSEVTGATDGHMTVATTGTYRIDFFANFATTGFESPVVELRKNGSALTCPVYAKVTVHVTENTTDNASLSVLVDATAADYFSLYSSGVVTDAVFMTNAHFTVQRVR